MADKKQPDKAVKIAEQPDPQVEGKLANLLPRSPVEVVEVNPSAGKTIDERMADLLADHKRMGAR